MRVAQKLERMQESATIAILDKVASLRRQGVDVLDLNGGEPDFDTDGRVVEEACHALQEGFTHYSPSRGIPELLTAIADKLRVDNQVLVEADSGICVTPSAKHALFIAVMTVLDPGDELMVLTPSWVSYQSMVELAGGTMVPIELTKESGFQVTRTLLDEAVTHRSKAILINTPNNPTGHVLSVEEIDLLADFAEEHDLFIITDEIYEKVIFTGHAHLSIGAHPKAAPRTLTINGFSKGYAMTGWRLGYVAGPASVMKHVVKVHQHTVGSAGSFVQRGGLQALTGPQDHVQMMTAEYEKRRDLLVAGLNRIPGIRCEPPGGALYAFVSIDGLGFETSIDFVTWLLDEANVAITPGSAFGPGGEGHVRIAYATSDEILKEAIERITTACATRQSTLGSSSTAEAPHA